MAETKVMSAEKAQAKEARLTRKAERKDRFNNTTFGKG